MSITKDDLDKVKTLLKFYKLMMGLLYVKGAVAKNFHLTAHRTVKPCQNLADEFHLLSTKNTNKSRTDSVVG